MMALDATFVLTSEAGDRRVKAVDFPAVPCARSL